MCLLGIDKTISSWTSEVDMLEKAHIGVLTHPNLYRSASITSLTVFVVVFIFIR